MHSVKMQQYRRSVAGHTRVVGLKVLVVLLVGIVGRMCLCLPMTHAAAPDQPNIVFIMVDDLGYGDLGCYGQKIIQTPRIDQMAKEGMLFRDFYAGNTVCAPSRSVLMTGQHMGHTWVRGNAGGDINIQTLRPQDVTVAEVLKKAGYATALCGKWGLGDDAPGNTGLPNDRGFELFYGYLNQVHAHNYYPEFLWRNKTKEMLRNTVVRSPRGYGGFVGGYATKRIDYSHDLICKEAMKFVQQNKDRPFFLYLPLTIPHANNEGTRATGNGEEVPDYGIYKDKPWSDPNKGYAAMVTRMDGDVGRLLDQLKSLGIARHTVVMFTSDNGPQNEGGQDPDFFDCNGPLRGMKRALYEGGVRVPMIVWWPGTTPAGSVSEYIGYFGDLMATAAQLAGATAPKNIDSLSFVPTITGHADQQAQHEYLYWEFYEQGSRQAVRAGNWKAIREPMVYGKTQLYDLSKDLSETTDLAAARPDILARMEQLMKEAHTPNSNWKVPQQKAGAKQKQKQKQKKRAKQ